jgi:general secretion pathway protein I
MSSAHRHVVAARSGHKGSTVPLPYGHGSDLGMVLSRACEQVVAVKGARSRQKGFTLLEVLVATVIMAVAVTGLLSALSTSMRNAARLTDYDRAALSARVKMDELLTTTQLPRGTVLEGPWEYGGWRARVTPFESLPNSGPGSLVLDRIELELWWMSGDVRRHLNLEAFHRSELLK